MEKSLRNGITTGACAAGAAKGAILALVSNLESSYVEVKNLEDQIIKVPILRIEKFSDHITCWVLKDGGDDPDITHGLEIGVTVKFRQDENPDQIIINGGTGVGIVTRPGLQVEVGKPAINPVPRKMIKQAALEALPKGEKVTLTVMVPRGEEIAKKTLNPRLGIEGGISILGTTGIVRPMSEEAYKTSLLPQITMAKAHGYEVVVLTPGGIGEKLAVEKFGLPKMAVIQMSNFVGYMLNACIQEGIKKVLLMGHHSKLLKVAGGSFHTHNKVSDGRREVLGAYAGLFGAPAEVIQKILDSNTAEEALQILKDNGLSYIFQNLAEVTSKKSEAYVFGEIKVGTVLLDLKGEIIGIDSQGEEIGRELGWSKD